MIGIYYSYDQRGPGKVVNSLINGFDNLNIDYCLNKDGDKNIILQDCVRLQGDLSNCIIGPNICTLPIDNSKALTGNYKKILTPSIWVKNLYSKWLDTSKIDVWSAGIDLDLFSDYSNKDKYYDFLIYFKRRSQDELNFIKTFLTKNNKSFVVIEYGFYTESQFIQYLNMCKRCIIIDNCESQGIAIQEIMSSNIPLLVWDVTKWCDRGTEYICDATSIPYWSDICGEVFYSEIDFNDKYEKFISNNYTPREYIKQFNINQQAKKIIDILYGT